MADEREEFLRRFTALTDSQVIPDAVDDEARELTKEHRKSVIFWTLITVLAVLPFLISGSLIFTINQYGELLGSGSFEYFSESFTSEELSEFGNTNGLTELEFMVSLYENRYMLVGITFAFFALIIAILVATRGLTSYLRNKSHA